MATSTLNQSKCSTSTKKSSLSNNSFENYLKKQTLKTTVNGTEIASFSWYKKLIGLI
ncbi:MAG: hypothetical protein WC197_04090 [Candidatus Gastranaerophilaceae bacterium]|jgi:hypothetical protein